MKKRILVVENNKDILDLISLVLDEAGYEVDLYLSETNIFEKIITFQPDAILLDIVKPTIEGTELCRQIKEAETTSHIPVIAISTHNQIHKVKEICADETIEKPFDIDSLLEILSEQLNAV